MRYILIADASTYFRSALASFLRQELKDDGIQVIVVGNFANAVTWRTDEGQHADLTILGGSIAESYPFDGSATAAAIHLDHPKARILILSLRASEHLFALRAERAGAELLDKNSSTQAILEKVRVMLSL